MNARSLFSGVGGLDLGLERAGLRVVSQCEKDPWRRRVLEWHWPDVPCAEDVREITARRAERPVAGVMEGERDGADARRGRARAANRDDAGDLLCGGFPCQDLSVAGRRAGLDGHRSGLFYEYARIADELQPRWLLVENVPGLLSSADGRDFAVVLSTLVDLGYGVAWRTLDARYFGVPQRRRRVFIVGHFGGDPEPALRALGQGGDGDLEAGECTWQEAPRRARGGVEVARSLTAEHGQRNNGTEQNVIVAHTLTSEGHDASEDGTGRGTPLVVSTLQAPNGRGWRVDAEGAAGGHLIASSGVRRLTPVECERLMSWPDNWTAVDGPKTPDSRRYAACGDGVVSNVAEWIGRRILAVQNTTTTEDPP